MTPYTQTDCGLLQTELLRVRGQGFCIVDQEFEIGMRVLGVPLLDRAGRLKATLTITTDAARWGVDEMRLRYLPRRYEAQALLRPGAGLKARSSRYCSNLGGVQYLAGRAWVTIARSGDSSGRSIAGAGC